MTKIKLFTADGGFVHDALVPPFVTPPEVIIWGNRVFKLDKESPNEISFYFEVFAYALPTMVSP